MGLLLSILVACVGVVELVAFYSNVRRNYARANFSELNDVTQNYLRELNRERNRLIKEIEELEFRRQRTQLSDGSLSRSEKVGVSISQVDLEDNCRFGGSSVCYKTQEYSRDNLNSFSQSNVNKDASGFDNVGLVIKPSGDFGANLPSSSHSHLKSPVKTKSNKTETFLGVERLTEESHRDKTLSRQDSVNIYSLKENLVGSDKLEVLNPSVSKLDENESVTHNYDDVKKGKKKVIPVYLESDVKKTELDGVNEIIVTSPEDSSEEKSSIFGRREPSPFPTYDRLAPRNSICSELIENPTISVQEIDEETYSSSPRVEEYLTKSNFDSREFWNRRTLKVEKHSKSRSRSRTPEILRENLEDFERKTREKERRRSKSENDLLSEVKSQLVEEAYWRRSVSPFQKIIDLFPANFQSVDLDSPTIVEIGDALDSVDGLKHVEPHEEHKRQFKSKKNKKKGKKGKEVSEDSDSGVVSADGKDLDVAGCSKKKEEPFWVKK